MWGEQEPCHAAERPYLLQLPGTWDVSATPVAFGDAPIQDDDRKRLATQLWQEGDRRFTPVVQRTQSAS